VSDARQVLLVAKADAEAAPLVLALSAQSPAELVRASSLEGALKLDPPPKNLELAVVDGAAFPPQAPWVSALRAQHDGLIVLVAARLDDRKSREGWVYAGVDGFVVLPTYEGLAAAVAVASRAQADARGERPATVRLRRSTETLVRLAKSKNFRGTDLAAALIDITEAAVVGLGASRVGVWRMNPGRTRLRLVDLYDATTKAHSGGAELGIGEHPTYFQALEKDRLMPVSDVSADPRVTELLDDYFRPNRIVSTVDVAVRLRGELVGALCAERQGDGTLLTPWTPEETMLAGALADLVSLALESSERQRAESALYESERRFRDLFLFSSDNIVLNRVAEDGTITCEDINPATVKTTGVSREEAIGKNVAEVLAPEAASKLMARYRQCIEARAPISYEQDLALPSGTRYYSTAIVPLFDEEGRVYRLASMARDITSVKEADKLQRELEARVAEAQKNDALARLAGHIAHDVNNLLALIVAHASSVSDASPPVAEALEAILAATTKGRELTQQILTFGRRRPMERQPVELGPLVAETLALLAPMTARLTVRHSTGTGATTVRGDRVQLQQVLTNLVTNACQSMPEGGTLTVAVEALEVSEVLAAQRPPVAPGPCVRVTVGDTGVGMDETTRQRVFEPFFTTRGEGTGLGLAVVQSVIASHQGAVYVDSAPGQGTRFEIYLPSLRADDAKPSRGQGQRILLIDDHPSMAFASGRLLETMGFQASVFDDPEKALEAFKKAPDAYDAVLTDLTMPKLSGEELTKAVKAVRPSLPVVLMSGRADGVGEKDLERLGVSAVLQKPWRLEEAVTTLHRVLRGKPPQR
jgi:PAS domain S-box-containing protein